MRVGIAADHGGFDLKQQLAAGLREAGHEVADFGAHELSPEDDYPDVVVPLARALAGGEIDRGVAVCGSGIGACIAANKIAGVRAAVVHDTYLARQGVEDDDMNVICLGGRVTHVAAAREIVETFLAARFKDDVERYRRRVDKVVALEKKEVAER
jgi:ribose 5-phosphate isomerase B